MNARHIITIASTALSALCAPVLAEPLNPLDFPSLGTRTLGPGNYTIHTETPSMNGPGITSTLTGSIYGGDIAVFVFDTLTVQSGAIIYIVGTHPVALLTVGDLSFEGTILVSGASGTDAVPGAGGTGGIGAAGGGSGGGGGKGPSFGSAGGGVGGGAMLGVTLIPAPEGASGTYGGLGAIHTYLLNRPAPTYGDLFLRLEGGSGGAGANANSPDTAGGGGAGGGAIELGALGSLSVAAGAINANGGAGGASSPALGHPGGAGSGGGILLHGRTITLGATISANGGTVPPSTEGNPGGGGRVALQSTAPPTLANITVSTSYPARPGVISNSRGTLSVTDLDFGDVPVGSSRTLFMGIRNSGDSGTAINGRFPDTGVGTPTLVPGVTIHDVSSALDGSVVPGLDRAAIHTVDGSGLNAGGPGTHAIQSQGNMWLTVGVGYFAGLNDPAPAITWDLGSVLTVSSMRLWNYNEFSGGTNYSQRGVHTADILVSSNGTQYSSLGNFTFNQAPGSAGVDFSQIVPLNAIARYVRLSNIVNYGAANNFAGLSEVQFTASPAMAFTRVGTGVFSALHVGEFRALPYMFAPPSAGTFTQTLTFLSDGGNATVHITGRGVSAYPADFNQSGHLEVQDIFDYLGAWFAGCP